MTRSSLRQRWRVPPIPGGPFLELCAALARETYKRQRDREKALRFAERYSSPTGRLGPPAAPRIQQVRPR